MDQSLVTKQWNLFFSKWIRKTSQKDLSILKLKTEFEILRLKNQKYQQLSFIYSMIL